MGVELPGQPLEVLPRQSQGLAQVLDDAFHRVGGNGPGQDGMLRPKAAMHPADEFVPQSAGKVQVDVGEQGSILGDEPLQGQIPPEGVNVADADEIAGQQGHRGSPAPARRPLLQRCLRVRQPTLLHDLLGQDDYLPVKQQEAGQTVPAY